MEGGVAPEGCGGGGWGVTRSRLVRERVPDGRLVTAIHEPEAPDTSLQVELGVRGDEARRLASMAGVCCIGNGPVASEECIQESERLGGGRSGAGLTTVLTRRTTSAHLEGAVRPRSTT